MNLIKPKFWGKKNNLISLLPDEFAAYEKAAYGKGFLMVSATPLTRSSYHAGNDFQRLRAARLARLAK